MGQILLGRATTPEAIRRTIHNSEERPRSLSARYGINQNSIGLVAIKIGSRWPTTVMPQTHAARGSELRPFPKGHRRACSTR